jgi:hypothetical protein
MDANALLQEARADLLSRATEGEEQARASPGGLGTPTPRPRAPKADIPDPTAATADFPTPKPQPPFEFPAWTRDRYTPLGAGPRAGVGRATWLWLAAGLLLLSSAALVAFLLR